MWFILAGWWLGLAHVLTGPDHLAAIAPLAVEDRKKAWKAGLQWGFGHSTGVLLVGLAILILRSVIPVDLISGYSERFVGVVLIGIGLWAFWRVFAQRVHSHSHHHDGRKHEHIHAHVAPAPHPVQPPHSHTHAALAIGTLHGLAGSSHILGILPALSLPSTALTIAYIVAFGLGTIAGMLIFSTGLGWLSSRYATGQVAIYRLLMITCGSIAIVTGTVWLTV